MGGAHPTAWQILCAPLTVGLRLRLGNAAAVAAERMGGASLIGGRRGWRVWVSLLVSLAVRRRRKWWGGMFARLSLPGSAWERGNGAAGVGFDWVGRVRRSGAKAPGSIPAPLRGGS